MTLIKILHSRKFVLGANYSNDSSCGKKNSLRTGIVSSCHYATTAFPFDNRGAVKRVEREDREKEADKERKKNGNLEKGAKPF